ncbi:unnamed protein product [Adineta steineri]|uniref:Peptidase M14 domain-containing protein n=1 Tax=Adineta steineri TaxID=433720 RepID=A0A813SNG3_9BILA|nr:unnamed protein product [Adineta steineri]
MRVGQSIWSEKDLNSTTSSLICSRTSTTLKKFHSDTELNHSFDENEHDDDKCSINSSKKLFSNINFRSRIYKKHQFILNNGTIKTTYFFLTTEIPVDDHGPFWPLACPMKHLAPSFSFLLRNENQQTPKEYYYLHNEHFLGTKHQQTFDNQPALQKYTDAFKHPTVIYDMDKTSRKQEPKPIENELICPPLIFESRFEGGNLRHVKRVGQFEYELVLRPDLYTKRHTQWYYFRVQNMIANVTYRLRIINLMKKGSLYNEGMRILMFSELAKKRELQGWHRVGHHINYCEHRQRSYNSLLERDINYYELDFQLEFFYSGDTCYIAHCYPYTFTDLKDDLDYLSSTRPRDIFRRDILCESQAGNSCFIITVTDESVPIKQKKFVFITARIHPGETNSSYMMRGLLEFVTSDDEIAKRLRSQLVFKIVPMLNPDGVIIGNYRCSLTGKDMNRNFRHPHKQSFPTIYHVKQLIQSLQKEQREILAFCDLHGHSRKSNVFAYGCDGCDGPQPDMKSFLSARVLPFLMSKTAPDMFAFDYCKFHVHRCKESTGRVVMWKEMLIKNSFTLEASFAGSSIVNKPCHFNIQDYEKFGQSICESLRQYLDILSDTKRMDSIYLDITKCVFRKLGKDKVPPALLPLIYPEGKQGNDSTTSIISISDCLQALTQCHKTIYEQDASTSEDSDSDPEGGELPELPYQKELEAKEAEAELRKKQIKKKRSEKAIEERIQKLTRKREPSEEIPVNSNNETLQRHRIRITHPLPAETLEATQELKLTLAVDQMDKASRLLPTRGSLFTSKYANRTGHGLPIFSTERALERKQKKINAMIQDFQGNDYDADSEQNVFTIREQSQLETSSNIDQHTSSTNIIPKRTASMISLTLNDILSPMNDGPISTISGTYVTQPSISKTLPIRRLHAERRLQTQQREQNRLTYDNETNLMELNTSISPLLNLSTSINGGDTSVMELSNRYSYDTQMDSNGISHHRLYTLPDNLLSPMSKTEMPLLRTGMNSKMLPALSNNILHKRVPKFKPNIYTTQHILAAIEPLPKEQSTNNIPNENAPQLNAMDRVNQIIHQLHLPPDKNKRS